MHKAIFLEGTLHLTITPDGPILIKAGDSGGADPTLPDMEFVRTSFGVASDPEQPASDGRVYIPGASLKGVVRAQCERICRSLDRPGRDPSRDNPPLADNPLGDGRRYGGLEDMRFNSGRYFDEIRADIKDRSDRTAIIYRRSSFVSRLFGNTSLASRLRFADAYPSAPVKVEERNGVAIDRIYGAVAVGPFNYETVVSGTFPTRIDLRNVTLAQLGLLGLALRDLGEGRVGIGFGKSRGLGRIKVTLDRFELYYPTCQLDPDALTLLSGRRVAGAGELAGLGALCAEGAYEDYQLPKEDVATLPAGLRYTKDDLIGVRLLCEGDEQVRNIWRACMPAWRRGIGV